MDKKCVIYQVIAENRQFGDLDKGCAINYCNKLINFLDNLDPCHRKPIKNFQEIRTYAERLSKLNNLAAGPLNKIIQYLDNNPNSVKIEFSDGKNTYIFSAEEWGFMVAISYATHSELVLRLLKDVFVNMPIKDVKTAGQVIGWLKVNYPKCFLINEIDNDLRNAIFHMDFEITGEKGGSIQYHLSEENKKLTKNFYDLMILGKKQNILYFVLWCLSLIDSKEEEELDQQTLVKFCVNEMEKHHLSKP